MREPIRAKRAVVKQTLTSRAGLIKLVSTGVAKLALDDDTARNMFFTVTGTRQRREMDQHQLNAVLLHLRERGFAEQGGKRKFTQKDYMRVLWTKLARAGKVDADSVQALNAWVTSQTREPNGGLGISSYTMVPVLLGRSLIERLKQWLERK